MLEPRRLATRAAARRMAVADRHVGRRPRRLPDPRRAAHRAGHPDRGRDRGRPDPATAARSRAARRRPRHLRRGPRTQPADRPRAGVHARRGGDAATRPAHPGDVGDGRHRAVRPPAGDRRRPAPGRRERGPHVSRSTSVGCRGRSDDRLEAAVGSAVRRALRDEDGDVLVVPARHRRDLTGSPSSSTGASVPASTCIRWPARCRSRSRTRRSRPSPPGRRRVVLVDRHRRDVTDGGRRPRRRRLRPGPRAAVRSGHRDDPADDGVDQPRLGRPARRARRAHRARCRLPAVEPDGARHPRRPTGRPRSRRSTSPGCALELAAWGTPPEQLSFVDPPPPQGAGGRPASCCTTLGALDDGGRRHRRSGGRWSGCPSTPAWPGWSPGGPTRLSCVVAAVVEERDVHARAHAIELPADLALRVALVCGQAARRPGRPPGRRSGARAGRRHRPPRRRALRRGRRRPRPMPGCALLVGFPDRLAGAAAAGPVPAAQRHRGVGGRRRSAGDGAVRRRRRPRRQAVGRPHPPRRRRRRRRDRHRCSTA